MQSEFIEPEIKAEILQKLQINATQLDNILANPVYDRILGCFMGASIGDALGSHCEFEGEQSEQKMEKVMGMPGGGTFPIKPGQITDDTELAIHCLQALQSYDPTKPLQDQVNYILSCIGVQYIRWLNSVPFDCGITCRTGFSLLQQNIGRDYNLGSQQMHQHLQTALNSIKHANHNSLSNGYLMRIAPIGMMMALIKLKKHEDFDAMVRITKGEINMTHGNNLSLQSGVQWVNLLSDLILREDPVGGVKEIFQKAIKHQDQKDDLWLWKKAGINGQLMEATLKSGFVKIAYSYGFNRLKWIAENVKQPTQLNADLFKNTMKIVIQKGGDTDTNAAIVGGLIGSIVGFTNLPKQYLNKQLSLRLTQTGSMYKRKPFYEPFQGLLNGIKLIKKFL